MLFTVDMIRVYTASVAQPCDRIVYLTEIWVVGVCVFCDLIDKLFRDTTTESMNRPPLTQRALAMPESNYNRWCMSIFEHIWVYCSFEGYWYYDKSENYTLILSIDVELVAD